jgi:hypothetical protein
LKCGIVDKKELKADCDASEEINAKIFELLHKVDNKRCQDEQMKVGSKIPSVKQALKPSNIILKLSQGSTNLTMQS